MLTIRDLKMTMGARVLFEDASFGVDYGDRVALVGPNGAGKTTLFSIILKQLEPDSGTVLRDLWTMVGHLPQEVETHGDESVLDVATGRVDELPRLEKRLHELEAVAMQHYLLLQRNLLYTGITRGKRLVVLFGQRKAMAMAVKSNRTENRFSGLLARLSQKPCERVQTTVESGS